MNLPNYFLADMPSGATITTTLLSDACDTLKRNRESYLADRSTPAIVSLLADVASEWLNPNFPLRELALTHGPSAYGFSRQTLAAGLDAFFAQVTAENLESLLEQDLTHKSRLDRPSASGVEQRGRKSSLALAPEFIVHVTAGNLPVSALQSMLVGVLLRSAQFIKCATGGSLIPRLFAHSLYQAEPKLGACLEIAEWRGGTHALEDVVFAAAQCITASGSDETLHAIRMRIPPGKRFLEYGHRVSFGYVAAPMLRGPRLRSVLTAAAADVAAWDQLGCLSPQVIFVEGGGLTPVEKFAELLADELQSFEQSHPRGTLGAQEAATITARRSFYEVRAAHSGATLMWQSKNSTAWTVVFEENPLFQLSSLHRFVYVKRVTSLEEALQGADAFRTKVSTVGLAADEEQWPEFAEKLARWGALRICPLGRMQTPPLTWRHDGRPALADFVRWIDIESP